MNNGIITKHVVNTANKSFRVSGAIPLKELKRYLLYWDQIIYPTVNGFGPNLESLPELKYLNENGILSLEDVTVLSDEFVPQGYQPRMGAISGIPLEYLSLGLSKAQLQIANKKLNAGEIWSIAQVGDSVQFPSSLKESSTQIEFELYNCLPVPGDDVSFDDIINFRISEKSNLNLLQRKLESFRREVVESTEPDRALIIARDDIFDQMNVLASNIINGVRPQLLAWR